jgi:hypothetical protein
MRGKLENENQGVLCRAYKMLLVDCEVSTVRCGTDLPHLSIENAKRNDVSPAGSGAA